MVMCLNCRLRSSFLDKNNWCIRCRNSQGEETWYVKTADSNYWVSEKEKATIYSKEKALKEATHLNCTLGRGTYTAINLNPFDTESDKNEVYLDFYVVQLQDGTWQASSPKHEDFMFDGTGDTMHHAIANLIITNREKLGIQFTIREKDGTIKPSTVYGVGRCRDELGPSESIVLDWNSSR